MQLDTASISSYRQGENSDQSNCNTIDGAQQSNTQAAPIGNLARGGVAHVPCHVDKGYEVER